MARGNQGEVPAELSRGRDRFAGWRRTKKPKSRIPQRFLELSPALAAVQECVIELEDGAVSLRVSLKGYSATEVATVGRSVRDSS